MTQQTQAQAEMLGKSVGQRQHVMLWTCWGIPAETQGHLHIEFPEGVAQREILLVSILLALWLITTSLFGFLYAKNTLKTCSLIMTS